MSDNSEFYTLKGYLMKESGQLSSAMEDYLEMIARLSRSYPSVRVGDLAGRLHVKASSATKMVQQLTLAGYLRREKYGDIALTDKGYSEGSYLLYRHNVLQAFLCAVNHTDSELELVEKIEHYLDRRTVKNLERLTELVISAQSSQA